jgi:hypothetical protein
MLNRNRRRAFVAEVKWGTEKVSAGLLDDLRRRVSREPDLSGLNCTFALISRNGFSGMRPLADDERLVNISRLGWTDLPGSSPGRR